MVDPHMPSGCRLAGWLAGCYGAHCCLLSDCCPSATLLPCCLSQPAAAWVFLFPLSRMSPLASSTQVQLDGTACGTGGAPPVPPFPPLFAAAARGAGGLPAGGCVGVLLVGCFAHQLVGVRGLVGAGGLVGFGAWWVLVGAGA
jgi:hypothetical protein